MHCPSCEILVEKRLLQEEGIEGVEASTHKKRVSIVYLGSRPTIKKLNKIFKKDGYTFSRKKKQESEDPLLIKINSNSQLVVNKKKLRRAF